MWQKKEKSHPPPPQQRAPMHTREAMITINKALLFFSPAGHRRTLEHEEAAVARLKLRRGEKRVKLT
jgi:hypothetical protein